MANFEQRVWNLEWQIYNLAEHVFACEAIPRVRRELIREQQRARQELVDHLQLAETEYRRRIVARHEVVHAALAWRARVTW